MYAALKAIRVKAAATVAVEADADNDDDESEGIKHHHDKYYSDLTDESHPERKRKDDSPEPSSSAEKISKQEEEKKLPPKKLNADGSFGDPKPKHQSSGRIPQPWLCPVSECSRNNFQWRKSCPHCGQQKPPGIASFIVATPKPLQAEKADVSDVKPVVEESTKKTAAVGPVKPPEELSRYSKNNANLEGLGQRRGGMFGARGRDGSDGVSMAERLAKMAGMTAVPEGIGKKEEKSWADIKNKTLPSLLEKNGRPVHSEERDDCGPSLRGGGGVGTVPGRARMGLGHSSGSVRYQQVRTYSRNIEPQYLQEL